MQATLSAMLTVKSEVLKSLTIDGHILSQANYVCLYEGEVQGTGVVATLPFERDDEAYGIERFSGNIGNRSGTFVLENFGIGEPGEGKVLKTIVPGSGTEDFCGIRGAITLVSVKDKKLNVTFQCEFDPMLAREDQPLSE
jgi:hypothetical protein